MNYGIENGEFGKSREPEEEIFTLAEVNEHIAAGYNIIPLVETINQREDVAAVYERLRGNGESFLLESADPAEHQGRYSFIGINPDAIIRLEDGGMLVNGEAQEFGDPYQFVNDFLGQRSVAPVKDIPPFFGGAAGLFGYDLARMVEPSIGPANEDPLDLPDLALIVPGVTVAFDTYNKRVSIIRNIVVPEDAKPDAIAEIYEEARQSLYETRTKITDPIPTETTERSYGPITFMSNMTKEEYMEAVEKAVKSNINGDTFQVVPSHRLSSDISVDREFAQDVFTRLKQNNPSRYGFLFEFDDFQVTGCSPETLVKVNDGRAECMAIAGTRKRGETEEEDKELAHDLSRDEKERAEHQMLVDLCRNDMNRVCDAMSVEVDPDTHLSVEYYSHVMHLTTKVIGDLKEGTSALTALASIAPAGTLSGAPKISAMRVIDQLEPDKRGFYGGAVGYFNYAGDLDTCIMIRSMVIDKEGTIHIQAGAGVVVDSDPESEFNETMMKAGAQLKAIDEVCNPPELHQQLNGNHTNERRKKIAPQKIGKRILLIDNFDSFTYNIVQYLEQIGADVDVVRNDISSRELFHERPDLLVVSPGPYTPKEAGVSLEAVKYFPEIGIPTLGICLGHQAIAMAFGAEVGLHKSVHGKSSEIEHDNKTIFAGIPSPMQVQRYHSLVAFEKPEMFERSAYIDEEDGQSVIMGLRHRSLPVEGVQFHPESIYTPSGKQLLSNFVLLDRP